MSSVKEFLAQGIVLDSAINAKLEMLSELKHRGAVTKSFLSAANAPSARSRVEETVEKLLKLEESINSDIDRYVDLRESIASLIAQLPDLTQRTVLEQHYLAGKKWAEIADANFISLRNLMYLHKKALAVLDPIYSGEQTA